MNSVKYTNSTMRCFVQLTEVRMFKILKYTFNQNQPVSAGYEVHYTQVANFIDYCVADSWQSAQEIVDALEEKSKSNKEIAHYRVIEMSVQEAC